jgi:hypothetical protein
MIPSKKLFNYKIKNNDHSRDDGLSTSERRMKMAHWVAVAYGRSCEEADFLRAAFVSTGFLVSNDGSFKGKNNSVTYQQG